MKLNILFFTLLCCVLLPSCSEEDTVQPSASFELDNSSLEVNQSMTLHFTGNAENVVVFPGDENHDYNLLSEGNSGLVVNKGIFTYSYSTPGVYKVVCVATNHYDEGSIILTDTCSRYIRVIDDCTTIDKLSTSALYDEIYGEALNENDWLFAMPRKIKYKTSTPSVALSQTLKFYIPSSTTKVFIDDEEYVSNKKYDLSQTHRLHVVSNEGTSRDYNLYTLNYGEFQSFSINGVTAKIDRTEYDYSYYEINMTVDKDCDLTRLSPEFTLYGNNEKVFINQEEQVSGTQVDFTNPVTYRFVVSSLDNPDISLESTCVVTITKQ